MTLIAEPFFICLLASMIWAPIVLMTALRFQNNEACADKVWPLALLIAALPALAAPVAAALGLSLRAAPPALPAPIAAPAEIAVPVTPDITAASEASPVTLAAVFEAAAALYLYGFLMFLALGIARHVWFSYRVGYAVEMDHPRLEAAFEGWRRRMGVKRKPRFAFTDAVSSVCVHGYFRPVVLMPEALLDRVGEHDVELMVAHEMAHIRRGDTTLFTLCTAVKAVFWFNPFIQRIAAQATLAAEQAADALVIANGAERRRYARCFVEGLRFAAGAKFGERELAPSFTPFDRRSRRERLDAILSGRRTPGLDWRARLGVAGGVIAAAALAFAQAALAVAPKAEDALTQAPVEGKTVKAFTQRSVGLDSTVKEHSGVDIAASRGAIVRAAGDGKVVEATNRYRGQAAWGNVVVIDHGHGLVTRYAHLDRYKVKRGDTVRAGDAIGRVGSTGRTGGRAHLHFEVIRDGAPIDPLPVLAAKPMKAPAPLDAPAPAVAPLNEATPIGEPRPVAPAAAVAPGVRVKIANGADGLKVPASPTPPAAVFEFMDVEAMSGEITALIGASADLADIEFKLRAFDAGDLQTMTMNLGADARQAMEENVRAAAEAVKRNAEIARREGARARAEAEREIERALERAERNREEAQQDRDRAQKERDRAQKDRDRAQRERDKAQRDRERAQQDRERAAQERMERAKERALERAERDAERNRERLAAKAERDRERLAEKAERARAEAEREMSRAIARFERDYPNRGRTLADEKKALAIREKALREAQQDLDRQLAELERRRAELERAEQQRD